jgi:hypothetical protein
MITRLLDPEDYEIDAVVVAALSFDLLREFFIHETRGYDHWMGGYVPAPKPSEWPKDLDEARPYLREIDGYILSPAQFDAVVARQWHPLAPQHAWEPYSPVWIQAVSVFFLDLLDLLITGGNPLVLPDAFYPWQDEMIQDMVDYLDRRSLPVMLVRVPIKSQVMGGEEPEPLLLQFGEALGADFVDGAIAFDGFSKAQIDAHWMPYDPHWNQEGSDRFADLLFDSLREWTDNFREAPARNVRAPQVAGAGQVSD